MFVEMQLHVSEDGFWLLDTEALGPLELARQLTLIKEKPLVLNYRKVSTRVIQPNMFFITGLLVFHHYFNKL